MKRPTVWIRRKRITWRGIAEITYVEVLLMAIADKYAMVRRKGKLPFVVHESDIMTNGFTPKPEEID